MLNSFNDGLVVGIAAGTCLMLAVELAVYYVIDRIAEARKPPPEDRET